MASPDLQLDTEKALKTFLLLQGNNLWTPAIDIHAGHEVDLALDGTYLGIIADPPDWYSAGGYNATIQVTFKFATQVSGPGTRAADVAAHAARTGALINLLCAQQFSAIRDALNISAAAQFIGFSTWEEDNQSQSPTDTQLVTNLGYEFLVHLTA